MKKNLVKAVSLALAAMMGMAAFSGCAGKKDVAEDNNAGTSAAKEELVMGTNAAFPPFEFVTSSSTVEGVGDFDGIDVAIAKKIADSMGKTLKIEDMEFDGLIASVKTGKVDMAVAGMTANDERRENVDFSDTYYTATQVMVVPQDSDIASAADLKNGKTVGVVIGYTGDAIVTDDLAVDESKITRANRAIDIVQDVKNGKLDAVVVDSATGKALADKNGLKVVEDSAAFESEEYAIAVQKGNTELLDAVNKVLGEMKANGEIEELAEKYDGQGSEA